MSSFFLHPGSKRSNSGELSRKERLKASLRCRFPGALESLSCEFVRVRFTYLFLLSSLYVSCDNNFVESTFRIPVRNSKSLPKSRGHKKLFRNKYDFPRIGTPPSKELFSGCTGYLTLLTGNVCTRHILSDIAQG